MTFSFFILIWKQDLMYPRLVWNLMCSQQMTFNFLTTWLYLLYFRLQACTPTPVFIVVEVQGFVNARQMLHN